MAEYTYTAYGLSFRSDLALPELSEGDPEIESQVSIRLGSVPHSCDYGHPWGYRALDEGIVLLAPTVATFWVGGGDEIIVDPVPGVAPEVLRLFLLSRPLAMLLQARGLFALHGSSVSVDNKALIFVGTKRAGKSTTAGAFHRRGATILNDDISAINVGTNPPSVMAGWQRIKLWPDALAALGHDHSSSELLRDGVEKRALSVHRPLSSWAVDVARIFVLSAGEELLIEELKPAEQCMALVRHAYASPHWVGNDQEAGLFKSASDLAEAVSIECLRVPREISQLDDLVDKILTDRV